MRKRGPYRAEVSCSCCPPLSAGVIYKRRIYGSATFVIWRNTLDIIRLHVYEPTAASIDHQTIVYSGNYDVIVATLYIIDFFRCFFVRFSSPAFSFLMDYWKNSLPSCSMIHFSPLPYETRVMAILDVLWACESSQKLGSSAQYLGNTFLYSFIKNKKLKKKTNNWADFLKYTISP